MKKDMEWWEKEQAYADLYRSGRQAKDIYKYIPDKYMEGVTQAFSDSDGYWIWLDEWHVAYDGAEDCGMIHEYNIADLKAAIKTIRKASEQVTRHRLGLPELVDAKKYTVTYHLKSSDEVMVINANNEADAVAYAEAYNEVHYGVKFTVKEVK